MYCHKYIIVLSLFCCTNLPAQEKPALLQNFANPALYTLNDKNCTNLSGTWQGIEEEFLGNGVLKGTYSASLVLSQEGNKVYGNSYISFDEGKNYGILQIRGLVQGNKFYFEEYGIPEQKFIQANTLWCLRTGELDIKYKDGRIMLEGANYKGYADRYYFECVGNVRMSLSRESNTSDKNAELQNSEVAQQNFELRPNPANHEVQIYFLLSENAEVQIDLFDLAGKHESNITSSNYVQGNHSLLFDLSPFPAGVHLVRMMAGNTTFSALLVIAR
jgi:hypothetical protein